MNKLLMLLCIVSMAFISCGDDDCIPGTFEENIIGSWNTPSVGASEAGTVTFNVNGTGVSSENGVFYSELSGEGSGDFDWSYDANSELLSIDWNFSNGGLGLEYDVLGFDCDNTMFNFFLNFSIERQ